MSSKPVTAAACLCALVGLSVPCHAAEAREAKSHRQVTAFQRLTDLRPQRLAQFRKALAEFGSFGAGSPMLHFRVDYQPATPPVLPEKRQALFDDDTLRVPPGVAGRDAWADEQFVIAGREEQFQDAAEDWVERRIKGSDAMARTRSSREVAPKFGWDGGPLAGFRYGPVSVMGGENQFHIKYTHRMKRPGWIARVGCGVEDGEERVAFSIGRSLYHATTARR